MELINHDSKDVMRVEEISDALEVTPKTVRKYIGKLFPEKMEHGRPTFLNESEVTLIKLELEKNQHLNRTVSLPKTDLEKRLLVQQAMNILNEEVEELKNKLTEAQPKIEFHDQVGDSTGLYSMNEAAKVLGTGRNILFASLRGQGIFFERQPYQDYINRGYFEVKTTTANGHIQKQTFVTPKGLQWLQKNG